jgi:hypothetical protein
MVASAFRTIRQQVVDAVRTGNIFPAASGTYGTLLRELIPEYARHYLNGAKVAARDRWNALRKRGANPRPLPPVMRTNLPVPVIRSAEVVTGPTAAPVVITAPPRLPPVVTRLAIPDPPPGLTVDLSEAFTLFLPTVRPAAERMATGFIREMAQTTQDAVRKAIADGLQAGEALSQIQARLLGITEPQVTVSGRVAELAVFNRKRAATIARTEASRAMHLGQYDYGKAIGAAGIEWLASHLSCPLCKKLNGQKRRYGEPFHVYPDSVPAPYRIVYFPPGHPNCLCAAADWFDE